LISLQEFQELDLRVADVTDVLDHPKADKLYILKVNLGDQTKQLVAGLRPYYTKEELEGKKVVIVNNLEPAVLRGERSEGMILVAQDGDRVVVLTVDKDVSSNSKVL